MNSKGLYQRQQPTIVVNIVLHAKRGNSSLNMHLRVRNIYNNRMLPNVYRFFNYNLLTNITPCFSVNLFNTQRRARMYSHLHQLALGYGFARKI